MFRTVPLCPSAGVDSPYTQQWYMSYSFVYSFRAGPSWYCSKAVYKRNCPKHVEFHVRKKFVKLVHLVSFIINKCNSNIFLVCTPYFSLWEWPQLDGGSSRILLGDDAGGGAVPLSLIMSSVLKFGWADRRTCARAHTHTHTHTELTICIINSNFCQTFQLVTITHCAVCLYELRNAPPIRRHM